MNKSKTKKLALLTTVVLLIVCFVPVVQGKKPSISTRPIEDWLVNNPYGGGRGYLDPDTWLVQRCPGPGILDDPLVDYEGLVTERLNVDQSLVITIHLIVKGMPMVIIQTDEYFSIWDLVFVGVMDFTYTAEIILEKKIPGGYAMDWLGIIVPDNKGVDRPLIETLFEIPKGKREPGAVLPSWPSIYYGQHVFGAHFEMLEFISDASGNYVSGEEGKVKSRQLAYYGYELDLEDSEVYQWTEWSVPEGVFWEGGPLKQSPLLMPETWPFEYITFY